jgi:hypothetical protein
MSIPTRLRISIVIITALTISVLAGCSSANVLVDIPRSTSLIATPVVLVADASPLATPQVGVEPPFVATPTPNMDDPLVGAASEYAKAMDVPLSEAMARLALQGQIGMLQMQLRDAAGDTFGGLWIQHQPEYRIVVAVTEGGEELVKPFIVDLPYADLIEVRTVGYTEAELLFSQAESHRILESLGIYASSGVDIMNGQVNLYIGNVEELTADLAQAGLRLPDGVVVVEVGPPGGSNRPSVEEYSTPDNEIIYFPKQAAGEAYLAAATEGLLVLQDGCLRIESEGNYSALVIWRNEHTIQMYEDSIAVVDDENRVVGSVGNSIFMGGGNVSLVHLDEILQQQIPEKCRSGSIWLAGESE